MEETKKETTTAVQAQEQQAAQEENVQVQVQAAPSSMPAQLRGLEKCFLLPKKAFIAAGGTEEQFSREVNFAAQAMLNNPFLIVCAKKNPQHLIEAIKNVALTGLTLNPELRLAYLVPYKGVIKFQSSYMGKLDIIMRTGVVKRMYADLVYSNDIFEMSKGSGAHLRHVPDPFGERGELRGGYFYAELANGGEVYDAMPLARIKEIMGRSESVKAKKTSPWSTDFTEMARKTILSWGFKFLPKTGISDSVVKALEASSQYDNAVFEDWRKAPEKETDDFDDDFAENNGQQEE